MTPTRTLAARSLLGLSLLAGVALLAAPAQAQLFHGASIGKACDPLCPGDTEARCEITVANVDEFGDALRVDEVCDTVNHASGAVTTCKPGAPFILETLDDSVTFEHFFTVAANDPDPLPDVASSTGVDLFGPSNDPDPNPVAFDLSFSNLVERFECCVDADCNDGNVCSTGTCDLQSHTCIFTPLNSATTCRPSAGVCDPAEVCDGVNPGCPADMKSPSGTTCRPSAGVCDPAEVCDGTSATCPADMKSPSGTVCRASGGVCDPAEVCDGTSATCPADMKSPSGTVCRPSAGVCDPAEVCDGSSSTCAADAKSPSGTVCRSAAGVCDVQEVCNGTSPTCPADGLASSGTVCRAGTGECDPPEVCTGGSPTCPADMKAPSGTPCTDTDGRTCTGAACDGNGMCNQTFTDDCEMPGCRITGGGVVNGVTDPTLMAEIITANFGGQVGAPCGCIGCFDTFDHIQGSFTYNRKSKKGSLKAKDYNSLVCGCDGRLDGKICTGDGPAPPTAPANNACFSGIADYAPNAGAKTVLVAFRAEVEDRGEPGTDDSLKMKIWIPSGSETAQGLADQVCCTNPNPVIRTPNVNDGSKLLKGNIQIHPQLRKSEIGACPVPHGVCTP